MTTDEFIKKIDAIVASMNAVLAEEKILLIKNLTMTRDIYIEARDLLQKRMDLNRELTKVLQQNESESKYSDT